MLAHFIAVAHAQSPGSAAAGRFVDTLNDVILFPLIALLSAVAFLIFLYGCFEYIAKADSEQARSAGKQHIMWGIVGLFIMLSAFALLELAAGTFGLGDELECANEGDGQPCLNPQGSIEI